MRKDEAPGRSAADTNESAALDRLSDVRALSVTALRRLVIGVQGYATRSRRAGEREIEEAIRTLSCLQLDSITAGLNRLRRTVGLERVVRR
jgi:hypothetical protein